MIANIHDLMCFGHVFDMFTLTLYIAAIFRNLLSLSPFQGLFGRLQINSLFYGPNLSFYGVQQYGGASLRVVI